MELKLLQPEQIIVPGEYELGNESILKIYFRIFDKGHGGDLPPVIVTTSGKTDELIEWLEDERYGLRRRNSLDSDVVTARREDYNTLFSILEKSPYMLIDGNHKSAAATLTHQPITALEIQSDNDFFEIERMVEEGRLFDFKRPEKSLYSLRRSFIASCLDINVWESDEDDERFGKLFTYWSTTKSTLRYCRTIKERIDELTSNGDLPEYMKERYL